MNEGEEKASPSPCSKSTKLIHGGLRYLKQMDFALVQEVGTERAVVHNIAPNLVKPEKMLLPLYQGGTYSKFLTSFGLDFGFSIDRDQPKGPAISIFQHSQCAEFKLLGAPVGH